MPSKTPETLSVRREESRRKSQVLFLTLVAASVALVAVLFVYNSSRSISPEALARDLGQIEAMVRDDDTALSRLLQYESRLAAVAEDARLYRVPVLIQGRAVYMTLTAAGVEEVANSLALEDLLAGHRETKGRFQSGNAEDWKAVLLKTSAESKDHLKTDELPAIGKRIRDLREEKANLESRRAALVQSAGMQTHR